MEQRHLTGRNQMTAIKSLLLSSVFAATVLGGTGASASADTVKNDTTEFHFGKHKKKFCKLIYKKGKWKKVCFKF